MGDSLARFLDASLSLSRRRRRETTPCRALARYRASAYAETRITSVCANAEPRLSPKIYLQSGAASPPLALQISMVAAYRLCVRVNLAF